MSLAILRASLGCKVGEEIQTANAQHSLTQDCGTSFGKSPFNSNCFSYFSIQVSLLYIKADIFVVFGCSYCVTSAFSPVLLVHEDISNSCYCGTFECKVTKKQSDFPSEFQLKNWQN